LFIEVAVET